MTVSTTGNIATVNLATLGTAGTYAKVTTDAYGRVSSGTTLVAADLPPHSAALITSGTLNTAQLPTLGTAGTYAKVTTDAYGRVSSGTTLVAADLPPHSAALITSGTLSVARGGTGVTSTPINGQVLIGNGTNYSLSTLTAGSGVSISNASGAITIAAVGGGSVTSVTAGTGLTGGPITSSGTLSLATAGTVGTYAKVTTDAYGRVSAGTTLLAADLPPHSAALLTSGILNTAQLPTAGTAGTYAKVTTDAYGRVTAGTTLTSSDVTSSLGFTPINKAGDTMTGALNHGGTDILNAGNIQMAASKTLALSGNAADPTGLVSGDKGKTWFNSTTNQIKYWNGSAAVALGIAGSGLSSFNGQTGNTQTLATPGTTGTAPAWVSAANAHTLNIPLASTGSVTAGLISNSDYNTFNGKVAGVTSGTGVTVSTTGNIATVNLATAGTAGTYAKVTTDAYGRVTAGTTLVSSDVTSSLGFTPINKAGDSMNGALVLPANGLTAGTNQLVLANGNVGIGSTAPGAKLDVNGTIKITGGIPGAGKVLTSDAAGLASWTTPLSGTVTSVGITAPAAGITVASGSPVTSSGSITLALANDLNAVESLSTFGLAKRTAADTWTTVTDNSTNWNSAFTDRLKWDGGATGLVAATGRTSLGLGTLATLSAVGSPQITDASIVNADISASAAIVDTKLATISTAGKVSGAAITSGTIGGSTAISTSGTITTTGNVGIGTTNPTNLLTLIGAASGEFAGLRVANGQNSGTIQTSTALEISHFQTGTYPSTKLVALEDSNANYNASLSFYTRGSSTDAAPTERMRIDSSGNVGIGSTSPAAKFQVVGGQSASGFATNTTGAINWHNGNIQTTSVAPGALTMSNMIDGAGYTLVINNTTGGNYTLSGTGLTVMCSPSCPIVVTAGTNTVIAMVKGGNTVWVAWNKGFQ